MYHFFYTPCINLKGSAVKVDVHINLCKIKTSKYTVHVFIY